MSHLRQADGKGVFAGDMRLLWSPRKRIVLTDAKDSIMLKRGWNGAILRSYLCRECRVVLSCYTPDNGWFSGQETWVAEDGGEGT